jgi:hypothetical protein
LGVEQLGVLLRGKGGAGDGREKVRRSNPKTQVPKPNLGHPPRFPGSGRRSALVVLIELYVKRLGDLCRGRTS